LGVKKEVGNIASACDEKTDLDKKVEHSPPTHNKVISI
jgi:hypothetical protein